MKKFVVWCGWFAVALFFLLLSTNDEPALAAVKQEVYVTGTVQSFGGYTVSEGIEFTIPEPGKKVLGKILVEGQYNGPYPWIMRLYTDNLHFAGVAGTIHRPGPAGLVSQDGQFVIPLEVNSPALGEGVWRRVPDLNEPGYRPYQPSSEPTEAVAYTDCIVMGIDPRNAAWVAGPDGVLFTDDDNPLGDVTAKTPFELTLRVDVSPQAVQGSYEATLYIEIVPAP